MKAFLADPHKSRRLWWALMAVAWVATALEIPAAWAGDMAAMWVFFAVLETAVLSALAVTVAHPLCRRRSQTAPDPPCNV